MKIFICHCSESIDRKKKCIEQFLIHNITDYEFIEKYNKDDLTYEIDLFNINQLKKSEISLFLKHIYIYQIISKHHENALIFEDDVILSDNFSDTLNKYLAQLPNDYDMLFIGDGCNLHIETNRIQPNINVYQKCLYSTDWGGLGCSRCSDSYIVSKKCTIEFINNFKYKINLPVEH